MKKLMLLIGMIAVILLLSCEKQEIPERCTTCVVIVTLNDETTMFSQEFCGEQLNNVINGKADTQRVQYICGSEGRH